MKIFTAILGILVLFLSLVLGYGYFIYKDAKEEAVLARSNFKEMQSRLEGQIEELEQKLSEAEEENTDLTEALEEEKDRVGDLASQVEDITGTVGTLEKLSKTDPELLQKYSKVFFLNEHYNPPSLKAIDDEYTLNDNKDYTIHKRVYPFLIDMIEEAEEDGIQLQVVSAYRSFGEQSQLKASYKVVYGEGANTFSADQGYSEHQLGTTVDFTSPETESTFLNFEKTEAYEWLQNNAHKYGFVLSYPPNNKYYQFEPWHWRFVGEELARDLDDKDMYFYDMDQRKIDEYLVNIFD